VIYIVRRKAVALQSLVSFLRGNLRLPTLKEECETDYDKKQEDRQNKLIFRSRGKQCCDLPIGMRERNAQMGCITRHDTGENTKIDIADHINVSGDHGKEHELFEAYGETVGTSGRKPADCVTQQSSQAE